MNKILLLAMLVLTSFGVQANHQQPCGVSGHVGVSSDWFFRGESMVSDGAHSFMNVNASYRGLYTGLHAGRIDRGNDASVMGMFRAGYDLQIMDNLSLDMGYMRHMYDNVYSDMNEVYAGINYGVVSLYGFHNPDSDDDYAEMRLNISRFVPVVDVNLLYGYHQEGDDWSGLWVSYPVNNWQVYAQFMIDEMFEGEASDNISVGFQYNF